MHKAVSIHGLLRALTENLEAVTVATGFNPRALTSPDNKVEDVTLDGEFQSTGSYEP